MVDRAAALIRLLQLVPHPEGGFFRETFRSTLVVEPADGRGPRQALTTIYYLLQAGSHSRWHRVASDEVWHLYEGGPLELLVAPPDTTSLERVVLASAGPGFQPSYTVPAASWQAAKPLGAYALAGCTVGPGFTFDDFEFAATRADDRERLAALSPDSGDLL